WYTSAACQIQNCFQLGRAKTTSGISHITNWGEYTLPSKMKAATMRKHNCAMRGRWREERPNQAIPRQHRANKPLEISEKADPSNPVQVNANHREEKETSRSPENV